MRYIKDICIFLIIIMTSSICLFQIPVYAESTVQQNVLILSSYNSQNNIIYGYESRNWTSEIISSINSEFLNSKKNITVEMNYMDSKNNFGDEYWQQLYNLYKYRDTKFDVVITLDDNAFNFLIKYGDELFPDTPVVFSGVNNFNKSMISNHPFFTGLAKSADIQSTIEVGLKLHPNTKQVFVILDKTSKGVQYKDLIEDIVPLYKDKVDFLFTNEENITKLKEQINNLPPNTIIYFDGLLKDKNGNYISFGQSANILFKDINIPMYSRAYIQINKESVGGMITEGSDLGKEIGKLALRILGGEKVSDIPVTEDSSHKYEFNYNKLKQFNIDIKDLPKGSKIINEPPTFYYISKKLIIGIIAIIIFIIMLTIFNIYKRRLVEKVLAENESLLRTVINSIPDIFYFKDGNNRLVEMNNSILDLINAKEINYKLKTIEELPIRSSSVMKNLISLNEYDKKAWESGHIFRSEETILHEKQGVNKIYDVIRIPLFNDDGTHKSLILLGRDITIIKEIEEELRKSKEMAEVANVTKSEFLANISHEIRTPINAIIGFSELMTQTIYDTKQKEYIENINAAGRSLIKLISDILDISKIEAGKLEINYTPVNPRIILEEIQRILEQRLSEKKLSLIIEVQAGLPTAMLLDEARLRQILLNIVGNAVKFTDIGYIKISMRKEDKNITDDHLIDLIISVEDTGIGVPEYDHEIIFESFVQQSGQNIKKFGGTGLGLYISKKLVEMMNGNITLTSVVGKGSTFTITLRDIQVSLNEINVNEERYTYNNKIKFEKAKVLVVDDVRSNRYLVKEILENAGVNVITAKNGLEAIEIAQNEIPDLIIMDSKMPVMGGIDATRAIRKISYLSNVPIIAMSANAMESDKENLLNVGINEYITKPINTIKFLNILQKWLKPLDESVAVTKLQEVNDLKYDNYGFIPKIDGVDLNAGIKRLCGNKKVYIKFLVEFFNDSEKLLKQIEQAIKSKEYNVLLNLLHGLKGASGNLSLTSVYAATVELESKIKKGIHCDYIKLFDTIADNCKKVCAEVHAFERKNQWMGSSEDSFEEGIVDKWEVLYCLHKLKNYLQDYDAKAVKYMDEIKEKLVGFIDESDIENIEEKVIIYEFDIALNYINLEMSKINNML